MVQRWDIITIGNISRNRYWGESDGQAYRPALCTCTLIMADRGCLLVDPSITDAAQMAFELERRTGVKPEQIDQVFITHGHGDHHFGLRHFPEARWLAAPGVAEAINASGQYEKDVAACEGAIDDDIKVIHTPGHTLDHHSLHFKCEGMHVIVAGDAVMTRDFFHDRRGYFNSADFDAAAQSIDLIAGTADIVVPGHDNWFLTARHT